MNFNNLLKALMWLLKNIIHINLLLAGHLHDYNPYFTWILALQSKKQKQRTDASIFMDKLPLYVYI